MEGQDDRGGTTGAQECCFRARDVAMLLEVSERTVWRWIAAGRLPVLRLGRRMVLIPASALAALLTGDRRHSRSES